MVERYCVIFYAYFNTTNTIELVNVQPWPKAILKSGLADHIRFQRREKPIFTKNVDIVSQFFLGYNRQHLINNTVNITGMVFFIFYRPGMGPQEGRFNK